MVDPLEQASPGRPASGAGHYLRDLVYGASDGIITTLVVIAGVQGAGLPVAVALILGLANLVADGFSMGASNYIGLKSELEQTGGSVEKEQPWRHGLATLAAFVLAGAVPLTAYVFPGGARFPIALVLGLIALSLVGAGRSPFLDKSLAACVGEFVIVGGVAAAGAFGVGLAGEVMSAALL